MLSEVTYHDYIYRINRKYVQSNIWYLALFPIIHLSSDTGALKEKKSNPRKLMKSLEIGSHSLQISQAVFEEFDSVDVARDADEYNTNAIILVGCKVCG